jgi:hypothetical protein
LDLVADYVWGPAVLTHLYKVEMVSYEHNETFSSTNETFTSRQTFWIRPPCCLHLSGGEQVVEAATMDVNKIL